ncbi:MAG: hypothetical protein WCX64_04430 [Candidatus Micrarchaeia archaeon]|jgi:hypothetical protein
MPPARKPPDPLRGRTVKIYLGRENGETDARRAGIHAAIVHSEHPDLFSLMTPDERLMRAKLISDRVNGLKAASGTNGYLPDVRRGWQKYLQPFGSASRYLGENYTIRDAKRIFALRSNVDLHRAEMNAEYAAGFPDQAIKRARAFLKSKEKYEDFCRRNVHSSLGRIIGLEARKNDSKKIKVFIQDGVAGKVDPESLKAELAKRNCTVLFDPAGRQPKDAPEDRALQGHKESPKGLDDESLLRLSFESQLMAYLFSNRNIGQALGHEYIRALGFLKEQDLRRISGELFNRQDENDEGFRDVLNRAIQNHMAESREFKRRPGVYTGQFVPACDKDVPKVIRLLEENRFTGPQPISFPAPSGSGARATTASQKAR